MSMDKEKKPISASELNRYSYCPYQWYYERMYGMRELRRLYQERNERLGLTDKAVGNFTRGLEHHRKSYRRLRWYTRLRRLAAVLVALMLLGLIGYFWVRYGMA